MREQTFDGALRRVHDRTMTVFSAAGGPVTPDGRGPAAPRATIAAHGALVFTQPGSADGGRASSLHRRQKWRSMCVLRRPTGPAACRDERLHARRYRTLRRKPVRPRRRLRRRPAVVSAPRERASKTQRASAATERQGAGKLQRLVSFPANGLPKQRQPSKTVIGGGCSRYPITNGKIPTSCLRSDRPKKLPARRTERHAGVFNTRLDPETFVSFLRRAQFFSATAEGMPASRTSTPPETMPLDWRIPARAPDCHPRRTAETGVTPRPPPAPLGKRAAQSHNSRRMASTNAGQDGAERGVCVPCGRRRESKKPPGNRTPH